jgi:hypothetical protein
VAYDESERPYPNYNGAPVKYIHSGPGLKKWSKPVLVARGGGAGHVLPHIVAGAPGKLDIAYWTGRHVGKKTLWFTTIAQVFGGLSRHPSIHQTRVTHISEDTGSASILMGACDQNKQTGGVKNGFACNRSADVWGIALTPRCDVTIAWPVRNNSNKKREATYETTQVGGRRICRHLAP